MTGHTKGPWEALSMRITPTDKDRRLGMVVNGPEDSDGWWPRICDMRSGSTSITEVRANAKLIAAAPDLLEACQQVLIASEDNGDMNDIDWQMLRDAIQKATGGE